MVATAWTKPSFEQEITNEMYLTGTRGLIACGRSTRQNQE